MLSGLLLCISGLSLVLVHIINRNLYLEIGTHNVTFQVVVYCIICVDFKQSTHILLISGRHLDGDILKKEFLSLVSTGED